MILLCFRPRALSFHDSGRTRSFPRSFVVGALLFVVGMLVGCGSVVDRLCSGTVEFVGRRSSVRSRVADKSLCLPVCMRRSCPAELASPYT